MPFEVPAGDELRSGWRRCSRSIYLIFNEGYAATAGDDWLRPDLCVDALRLGRILPSCAARARGARAGRADGDPGVARRRAHRAATASRSCCSTRPRAVGPAADPARAAPARARAGAGRRGWPYGCRPRSPPATRGRARPSDTDWVRIAALYDGARRSSRRRRSSSSTARSPSVVAFGPGGGARGRRRAGDRGRARGPSTCCRAVRGDLLCRLAGRFAEARAAFERAASLTRNERERQLLLARAAACAWGQDHLGGRGPRPEGAVARANSPDPRSRH